MTKDRAAYIDTRIRRLNAKLETLQAVLDDWQPGMSDMSKRNVKLAIASTRQALNRWHAELAKYAG